MKNFLKILVLIPLFIACENIETGEFGFNGELQFKHGQLIKSNIGNSVSLEIININDSRCPSDVTCIWAGEARITFEFKNSKVSTFELSTQGPLKDTVDHYSFELIDVSPYPVSTKKLKLNDYTVTLDIKKL